MRNIRFIGQAKGCQFFQLPFDILEDITEHLSRRDLCNMMLASRECSSIAVRALYSSIPLRTSPDSGDDRRAYLTLRRRQFAFLVAISQHPNYTRFIRRIAFEFPDQDDEPSVYDYPVSADLVWRTFAKCTGVVYVDLKATQPHQSPIEEPKDTMFPNLRHARIEGPFTPRALDKLLNTSSSIKTLALSISRPHRAFPPKVTQALPSHAPVIGPFDDLRGGFPSLRTLNIQIHPGVSVTSLGAFLQQVEDHVTYLILRFSHTNTPRRADRNDAFWMPWVLDSLRGFKALEQLWLLGIAPDAEWTLKLKTSCPSVRCLTGSTIQGADHESKMDTDI